MYRNRKKHILIVDDNAVNRQILRKLLGTEYPILEAENGAAALALLQQRQKEILCIILDLLMPVMDGRELLRRMQEEGYSSIPSLVTTAADDARTEQECLQLGAWDFVRKPYDATILRLRLQSIIARSQMEALSQVRYLSEHDPLTGLYNRTRFFAATRELLDDHPEGRFALLRVDIDRFRLVNSFFGEAQGDDLLRFLADSLRMEISHEPLATYGRIESDAFAICMPYDEARVLAMIGRTKEKLAAYLPSYYIEPSFGIRLIHDPSTSVETLYNQASMAARHCKGHYMVTHAFYDPSMSESIVQEQEIMNEAQSALDSGQFVVYLQPKYNLKTGRPYGAEALVRWVHPTKGMISPGKFIPVFERNGFVGKLDYYMWESTCRLLRGWLDAGLDPAPISVNISRVNMYNPHLTDLLNDLVDKYRIPAALLNLELTESAYMDNPQMMKKTVAALQERGFTVMMDDFGSGYSSLNTLKDIPVDVLKVDMKFLPTGENNGRSERILASVIRMAEWLDLVVVVEGVESEEQKTFLETIGCGYVQGFYFARPMPVSEYETLLRDPGCVQVPVNSTHSSPMLDAIWSSNPQVETVFSTILQPAAIYEYTARGGPEPLRVNHAFLERFGYGADMLNETTLPQPGVVEQLRQAFAAAVQDKGSAEYEYLWRGKDSAPCWIHAKLQYVQSSGDRAILFAIFSDITAEHQLEMEVQRYRRYLRRSTPAGANLLIVDDNEMSRAILREIFRDRFSILEAENGREALELLQQRAQDVSLILLDMSMPVMNGREFLEIKNRTEGISDIPVVVISADGAEETQLCLLRMGVNDYITKPFVPEVTMRRICNVLDYNDRFQRLMREYRAEIAESRNSG
jgi:diguanylate cyclase (GGDEF)-like protein/PAS domain S-box-containing protein